MICSHCRFTCADGAAYCPCCGTALQAPPPVQPQPPYGYVPRHPVIEAVRSVILSKVFLVALIALTAAVCLNILGSTETASTVTDFITEMQTEMGMGMDMGTDATLPEYTDALTSVASVFGTIGGSVPNVLLLVGLWMTYASAKKYQSGISTAGLTLVWVMQIIGLVGICIAAAVLALIFMLAGLGAFVEPDVAPYIALIAVLTVLLGGLMALVIVYQVKVMKMVNAVRQTLTTGVPADKISMLVVVMCYIGGVFSAVSALGTILLTGLFTGLATAASAVASITFALTAQRYRDTMRQMMAPPPPTNFYPQAGTVYSGSACDGQPVYVPQNDPYVTADIPAVQPPFDGDNNP